MIRTPLFVFAIVVVLGSHGALHAQDAVGMLEQMQESIGQIHTLSYQVRMTERVNGKTGKCRKARVKLSRDPLRLYYYQIDPNPGMEILYNPPEYGNAMVINPNRFPWFNLKLNPTGKLVRKGRHHTIFDAGFGYIGRITGQFLEANRNGSHIHFSLCGDTTFRGVPCKILVIENDAFLFHRYRIKKGETLSTVADAKGLNDYMLLERNQKLDWYDSADPGTRIILPNTYGKRVVYYLGEKNMLPVMVKVYDDISLYETIEFSNIKVNPAFDKEDFLKQNQEYGF